MAYIFTVKKTVSDYSVLEWYMATMYKSGACPQFGKWSEWRDVVYGHSVIKWYVSTV